MARQDGVDDRRPGFEIRTSAATHGVTKLQVAVRRLDPGLPLPRHQHEGDAGIDVHSTQDVTIAPGERVIIGTGIAIAIPPGYVGLGAPRSGLAARHGLAMVNAPGIVDSGYRGEVRIILVNLDPREPIEIKRGDRIGQIVVVPCATVEVVERDDLEASARGEGGFGSTGS